jgi:hypothetical protein
MASGLRSVLCAAAVILCGTAAEAQIAVLPLVGDDDPIKLSNAAFDSTDPERPAITLRLENMSTVPFSTDRIWISLLRFYTPDETRQNKDGKIWSCGLMTPANHDHPKQALELLPGASLQVRMPMGAAGCVVNPQHEHFSASVSHISAGRGSSEFVWKREAGAHGRLLQAAISKVH